MAKIFADNVYATGLVGLNSMYGNIAIVKLKTKNFPDATFGGWCAGLSICGLAVHKLALKRCFKSNIGSAPVTNYCLTNVYHGTVDVG